MTFRVCVLLSGSGRSLQNLIDYQTQGRLDVELVGVVSSRAQAGGLDIAAAADIPSEVVCRRDFDSVADFSTANTLAIKSFNPDLVVMAGYLSFYELPSFLIGKTINIHPSLLPLFGGQGYFGHHVHNAVIASGMRVSGCTVHFVDNQYDHGPIAWQTACPVLPSDDANTLAARVFGNEKRLLPSVIHWIRTKQLQYADGRSIYSDDLELI